MKIFKKAIILILAIGMLLQVTACSSKKTVEAREVEITVSDEEFDKMLSDYNIMYAEKMGEEEWKKLCEEDENTLKSVENYVLQSLILEKIFVKEADDAKIEVTDGDLTNGLIKIKKNYSTEEEYKKEYLEKYGLTDEYVLERITINTKVQKFLQEKQEEFLTNEPSKKQLKEIYEKNPTAYNTVRASHILVATEDEALEALKQLKEGKDFAELATEISTCPSSTSGGDLQYFTYSEMVSEFSEVAFNMNIGEISDPVKTEYGYHIIKVTDIKNTFNDVDEDTLVNAYQVELYNNFIDDYFMKAKVNMSDRLNKIKDRIVAQLNSEVDEISEE